jgi:hypothetical protein
MTIKEEIEELENKLSCLKRDLTEVNKEISQVSTKSEKGIISQELYSRKIKLEQEIQTSGQRIEYLRRNEITQNIENELDVIRKSTTTASGIEPKFSVIRPNIKLVDANLAYKYADLQSEVNTFVGFTTLFLGTFIGSCTSLGISTFTTTKNETETAIHFTSAFMSLVVSIIFGVLAWKANNKSQEVKKALETETGENEVIIRLIAKPAENQDSIVK